MKIPNKIILFGETFAIKIRSKNDKELNCAKCSEKAYGTINFDDKCIVIADDVPDQEISTLLFHELGHYFGEFIDGGGSEAFANAFSKYFTEILNQLEYK